MASEGRVHKELGVPLENARHLLTAWKLVSRILSPIEPLARWMTAWPCHSRLARQPVQNRHGSLSSGLLASRPLLIFFRAHFDRVFPFVVTSLKFFRDSVESVLVLYSMLRPSRACRVLR